MLTLADVADHPHQRFPFRGPAHTIEEMRKAILGPRGEGSVTVHNAVSHIVRQLQPKDYLSEILAVRHWVAEHVRYKNDPVGVEYVQDPQRMLEDIAKFGKTAGDCFPEGTLVLTDDYRLVPVEQLEVGDRIWGLEDWVTVEGVVPKGSLPQDAILLNNGSHVMLTPDHHVYVLECPHHGLITGCECADKREQRVRVSELESGMELTFPSRLPACESGIGALHHRYQEDEARKIARHLRSARAICGGREMGVHYRLLHKMEGMPCCSRLLSHPSQPPVHNVALGSQVSMSRRLLVQDVVHHVAEGPVWDIQTSDHHVYLPEHDVTVSQCDDIATLMAAMHRCLGRETELITVGFGAPRSYSHVLDRAREPKSRRWIVCDPVAGTNEERMLARVTTWKAWPID